MTTQTSYTPVTAKEYQKLLIAKQLLELFTTKRSKSDYLDAAVRLLRAWSGCQCLGIRLSTAEGFIPYHAVVGFDKHHLDLESNLCFTDACICPRVMAGQPGPKDLSCTTPYGSFFCNNSKLFLKGLDEEDLKWYRANCIKEGFLSLATVPIRHRDAIIGAIHLADKKANMVPVEVVEAAEHLSLILGEIIHRFSVEAELARKDDFIREQWIELNQIYDTTPLGLCLWDPELRFVRVNRKMADFIGRPAHRIRGKTIREAAPRLSARIEPQLTHVLATGAPILNLEMAAELPSSSASGELRHFTASFYPLKTAGETIKGVNAVFRETTEEKRMQIELENHIRLLKERNEELRDFVFVASHDLKEPLRKIHTFTDFLGRRLKNKVDAQSLDYLERARSAAARMKLLLADLLTYSRLASKGPAFREVDLNQVVHEVIDDLEPLVREKDAAISVEQLPMIQGDSFQLRQLFLNLISNAVKYNQEKPRIRIYEKSSGMGPDGRKRHQVFVEDNGIGFDPKYTACIFRPFQRLHGPGDYEGTGMGLTIVKKVVDFHGGAISAESAPGRGTTFTISLPG